MTAAYRLKGIGWFASGVVVTLAFYLVSLQVAAERKKLESVNASIASTERDIRALETEFDTRANLAQLERWNGDTLALSAPQASQFVRDEAQLASIDARQPLTLGGPEVKTAALVVPSLPAPAPDPAATPAPATPAPAPTPAAVQMAKAEAKPAPVRAAPVRAAMVQVARVVARPVAPLRAALTRVAFRAEGDRVAARPAVALRAKPEMAMLDRKLLSDTTFSDLLSGARAERTRLR